MKSVVFSIVLAFGLWSGFAAELTVSGETNRTEAPLGVAIPNELQLTLVASLDRELGAVSMDVDERGRIWVLLRALANGGNRTAVASKPSRLLLFRPADQEGKSSESFLFYEDSSLDAATGITCVDDRVVVAGARCLFVLTDSDRDGQADRRNVLVTGLAERTNPPGVSPCTFGPDGKLYFMAEFHGAGPSSPETRACPLHGPIPDRPAQPLLSARWKADAEALAAKEVTLLIRCELDGRGAEIVAEMLGRAGPVGVDAFGTIWQAEGRRDVGGLSTQLESILEGSRPVADQAMLTSRRWPTSVLVYEGRTLARRLWNRLIVCDDLEGTVEAIQLVPGGSGGKVEREFLVARSNAVFRPMAASVAPDGSLYLLNGAHPREPGLRDEQTAPAVAPGVYRLARKGAKPHVPAQDWGTPRGSVGALQSGNAATRQVGWIRLHTAEQAGERYLLMLSRSVDLAFRARAFQLLGQIKGNETKYIAQCLRDPNGPLRLTGLRLARAARRDLVPLVQQLMWDPSSVVRDECAIALQQSPASDAPTLWAALAVQYDGWNARSLDALVLGAEDQWDRYLPAWLEKVDGEWNTSAGREILWQARTAAARPYLQRLSTEGGLPAEARQRVRCSLEQLYGSAAAKDTLDNPFDQRPAD